MFRTVSGLFLAVAWINGQPISDLLLPQSHHIVGMVVDAEGKPVAEAQIEHSNDRRQAHQTDANGRFELDTKAPSIVIRKARFRSELVRTQDATEIRITLQKRTGNQLFPSCSRTVQYEGVNGWEPSFQFPKVAGITASIQGNDSDYGARNYYINTAQGLKGIRHGSGAMWTFGMPIDQDVWRSVRYEEVNYNFASLTIMDARGQFQNGNRWRYLGKFGESASYSDVDTPTAKALNGFMDGACMKPASLP
jgi:hypothetical protein